MQTIAVVRKDVVPRGTALVSQRSVSISQSFYVVFRFSGSRERKSLKDSEHLRHVLNYIFNIFALFPQKVYLICLLQYPCDINPSWAAKKPRSAARQLARSLLDVCTHHPYTDDGTGTNGCAGACCMQHCMSRCRTRADPLVLSLLLVTPQNGVLCSCSTPQYESSAPADVARRGASCRGPLCAGAA